METWAGRHEQEKEGSRRTGEIHASRLGNGNSGTPINISKVGASYEEVESKPASGQEEETRIIYKCIGREYS